MRRLPGILLACLLIRPVDDCPAVGTQSVDRSSLYEIAIPLFDLLTLGDLGRGAPITHVSQWGKKRQFIKEKWIKNLLGEFPAAKVPLDIRENGSVEYPDYTQNKVDYATESDDRVTAYLLLPKPLVATQNPPPVAT